MKNTKNNFQTRKRYKLCKGFTLVELILYVALVATFVTSAVYFVWDVVYGREKAFQQQIVNRSARIAMERIAYEIRRAKDVDSISSSQIVLNNDSAATTTISLNAVNNSIEISPDGAGPYALTSNQARVTNLSFTDFSSSAADPTGEDSNNIHISMTLEQSTESVSGQLTGQTTLQESVELNSQFNQSRRLLINLSEASLVSNTSLQGITIRNSGADDVVFDMLEISWEGISGGENIVEVQMGGGAIEWTGSQVTGSIIDLTDFTLTSADGIVDIDYLDFDSDMAGARVILNFILSDASTLFSALTLEVEGTPTPTPAETPTPTPTTSPASTCSDYCVSVGYSSGACRQNALACTKVGEINEAGGDQYCTGGPTVDTCCCLP